MGFYGERVLPRIINIACNTKPIAPLRHRVCEGLTGDVVEIGFGSELNVPHYPSTVTRVAAVEPSERAWGLAERRLAGTTIPVQQSGLDGQSLPFADDSFDSALSSWTMCTIPDVAATLAELRRVLKPGATLHFLEHARPRRVCAALATAHRAPEQADFGGCRLTKPIVDLITAAGFAITDLDVFYQKGAPKFGGADSLGTALSPATPGAATRRDDFSTLRSHRTLDSKTRRLPDPAEH